MGKGGVLDGIGRPDGGFLPIVDIFKDVLHAFFERDFRMPVKHLVDLRRIGPSAIWFARALRDVDDVRILAAKKLDEAVDGVGVLTADVEALAEDFRIVRFRYAYGDISIEK